MADTYDIPQLIARVKAGKPLTRDEEIFYLMNLLNHTKEEAEYIVDFEKNKGPHTFIH